MRKTIVLFAFVAVALVLASGARAQNCIVINQLDSMYWVQKRLMRDPASALFTSDILHLRQLSDSISQTQVVEAVGGTSFAGNWRVFRRFLQDTRDLLAQTSLGDPFSTRSHFDARVVATLAEVERRLLPLRCTEEQTAKEVQANLSVAARALSDREQVEEALDDYGQFISDPRTLLTAVLGIAAVVFGGPWMRKLRLAYRCKAKRHGAKYKT